MGMEKVVSFEQVHKILTEVDVSSQDFYLKQLYLDGEMRSNLLMEQFSDAR